MTESARPTYRLTASQRDIWLDQLLSPHLPVYDIGCYASIRGPIDAGAFREAMAHVVRTNDALRTVITDEDGEPRLRVLGEMPVDVELVDASREADPASWARRWMDQDMGRMLKLYDAPLFRFALLKLADDHYYWYSKYHHVIIDGLSTSLVLQRLADAYTAIVRGKPLVAEYPSYIDRIHEDEQFIASDAFARQRDYWADKLRALPDPLLTARPRKEHRSERRSIALDRGFYNELLGVAKAHETSDFALFLGALAAYFRRTHGRRDLALGIPMLSRHNARARSTVGLFVNLKPLRVSVPGDVSFVALMQGIKRELARDFRHQRITIGEINRAIQLLTQERRQVFDVTLSFERHDYNVTFDGAPSETLVLSANHEQSPLLISIHEFGNGERVWVDFEFNPKYLDGSDVERMADHFKNILHEITERPARRLSEISLLGAAERRQILSTWSAARDLEPPFVSVVELFEEQAAKHPDRAAVRFEGEEMTYAALNTAADRLARTLLDTYHARPGDLVGVKLPRSPRMLIALLGILKAGAAYLPIDPATPSERAAAMVRDADALLVLTEEWLSDHPLAGAAASSAPRRRANPDDLAYVIYTSGSTGVPKGCRITHGNLANYVRWACDLYLNARTEGGGFPLFSSLAFDFTVTSIFCPLSIGGCVTAFSDARPIDAVLTRIFDGSEPVDVVKLTPSHVSLLEHVIVSDGAGSHIHTAIIGGEEMTQAHVQMLRRLNPRMRIVNEYGPSETTVGCVAKVIAQNDTIVIGSPIAGTSCYVLDDFLHPQPAGAKGEIYIGGACVGQGYHNKPAKTAQAFIPNPFGHGDRLYRTGDLGAWRQDGALVFHGRADDQVKIRGHRVECGEVVAQLTQISSIRDAAVVARALPLGGHELVAYVVADALNAADLRSQLSTALPDAMIPARFVRLDRLPLTPNGKVDKDALPAPVASRDEHGGAYRAPRNDKEALLAGLWSDLLGRDEIGVGDNFFALGGDSITALRLISRLRPRGYSLEIRDIFRWPVIAELAPAMKAARTGATEEPLAAEAPLLPIQQWFFDHFGALGDDYHNRMTLIAALRLAVEPLRRALEALLQHHDALRAVFTRDGQRITQRILEGASAGFEVVDLTQDLDAEAAFDAASARMPGRFDLTSGPLVRVALFRMPDHDRLLLMIHHLIVDGVSWRILLEDLATAYRQSISGEPIRLPPKSASFLRWAEDLRAYGEGAACRRELDAWLAVESCRVAPLPRDGSGPSSAETLTLTLSAEETEALLRSTHHAYRTRTDELLLTALARAMNRWHGSSRTLVCYESHGRDWPSSRLDVSRTVGWFTAIFPVVLDLSQATSLGAQIRRVKETLRRVPGGGLGYGILSCSPESPLRRAEHADAITFNYLGRFDDIEVSPFSLAELPMAVSGSRSQEANDELSFAGLIQDRRLRLSVTWNARRFQMGSMRRVIDAWAEELKRVITHCVERRTSEVTPADLSYPELDLEVFDRVLSAARVDASTVEDIYPLSPLQEGLLFEHLADEGRGAYFQQVTYRMLGDVDMARLEGAWRALATRHPILRTLFVYQNLDRPLQVVLQERPPAFHTGDLRAMPAEAQAEALAAYAESDRRRSFDLTTDPLVRVAVLRTGELERAVVWSYPHILLDGWSMATLMDELFRSYRALEVLPTPPPYARLIAWLERRDPTPSQAYWSRYLAGYEETATFPRYPAGEGEHSSDPLSHHTFALDAQVSAALRDLAVRSGVTVSTVIQAAWAAMLARGNRVEDVVFGITVSGRPQEIDDVESMVGLFINTIPVRIRPRRGAAFRDLIKEVQADALEGAPHHVHPLAMIQRSSPLQGALFDHLMIFEDYPIARDLINHRAISCGEGISVDQVDVFEQTHYDFTISVLLGDRISFKLSYRPIVIDARLVGSIEERLKRVFQVVLRDDSTPIGRLETLSEEDRRSWAEHASGASAPFPADATLVTLFEELSARTPDRAALVHEGRQFTFREVNEAANRICGHLRERASIKPDDLVALMLERSSWMLPSILGILKAGAAYVPIEPRDPAERIRYIIEDCRPRALLTSAELVHLAAQLGAPCEVIAVESGPDVDPRDPETAAGPQNLAYVMYTSGSTGKPKGVMVEHRSVVNQLSWLNATFGATDADVVLQKTPFTFDISVLELFSWAFCGSTLCMLPPRAEKDPEAIVGAIHAYGVTVAHFVPSLLHMLVDHLEGPRQSVRRLSTLKRVFACGEALGAGLVRRFGRTLGEENGTLLHNLYGPTEATCDVSYFDCIDPQSITLVPIGKPMQNTQIHVMDMQVGEPMPPGCVGEICIAGACLARGYLDKPELTRRAFVEHPFESGARMYRTGDLGAWLADGSLAFLGRMDEQVKIAGHRIECGEVEHAILRYAGVREVVVIARSDGGDAKELVAYLKSSEELSVPGLRAHLADILPAPMIPSRFVSVSALPRTSSGKIDRRALPSPGPRRGTETALTEPENEVEAQIATVWRDVLRAEQISVHDDFFFLGGDSLKLFRVLNQLSELYPDTLRLSHLFEHRTIRELAKLVKRRPTPPLAAAESDDILY